jgi:hypothetical protein
MDRTQYVRKRKGRYMAQLLSHYEQELEPRLPDEVNKEFKAMVRRKFEALTVDVTQVMEMEDMAMNGYARDIKDRIYPDTPPADAAEHGQKGRR